MSNCSYNPFLQIDLFHLLNEIHFMSLFCTLPILWVYCRYINHIDAIQGLHRILLFISGYGEIQAEKGNKKMFFLDFLSRKDKCFFWPVISVFCIQIVKHHDRKIDCYFIPSVWFSSFCGFSIVHMWIVLMTSTHEDLDFSFMHFGNEFQI